jgi:hypothetical protein
MGAPEGDVYRKPRFAMHVPDNVYRKQGISIHVWDDMYREGESPE